MHEVLAILTDIRDVSLSVCLSVTRLESVAARAVYAACRVQPLSNAFCSMILRCHGALV